MTIYHHHTSLMTGYMFQMAVDDTAASNLFLRWQLTEPKFPDRQPLPSVAKAVVKTVV